MKRKMWDKTLELFQKINEWIPMDVIFWAGIALVGVVLVLAITGCALRKRLVPHWLILLYFAFASVIIFADNLNLANIVANLEYPFIIMLICYIIRAIFYRAPRYHYVKAEVYERRLAPKIAKQEEVRAAKAEKKALAKAEKENAKAAEKAERESAKAAEKAEREAAQAEKEAAKAAAKAEKEAAKNSQAVTETVVKEKVIVNDVPVKDTVTRTVVKEAPKPAAASTSTIELPEVEPMTPKTYAPVSEPTVITTPLIENLPDVKKMPARQTTTTATYNRTSTTSSVAPRSNVAMTSNRPLTTIGTAPRSTVSTTPVNTNSTVTRISANGSAVRPTDSFTAMYQPRVVKTTTVTEQPVRTTTTVVQKPTVTLGSTTRTTTTQTSQVVRANQTTTNTNNTTTTKSTQDIMDAIARLRASMGTPKK